MVALSSHAKATAAWIKWAFFPILLFRLIREIRKREGVTVISFLDRPNLFNVVASFFCGHHCITSIRTDIVEYYNGSRLKQAVLKFLTFFYRRADKVVFNSTQAARRYQQMLRLPSNKLSIVQNAFSIAEIQSKASVALENSLEEIFQKRKVVITVGHTYIYKGHWYLLRIFKQVKKQISDASLIIAGDGDMYDALLALAKELKLDVYDSKSNQLLTPTFDVYFLGQQQNPYALVSRSHIFVLTSILEGSPNVLNEALICGKEIIAADCNSGPREIIIPESFASTPLHYAVETENGILMPAFDGKVLMEDTALSKEEKLWVDVLTNRLRNESALVLGRASVQAHIKNLAEETVLENWENLVNNYTKD